MSQQTYRGRASVTWVLLICLVLSLALWVRSLSQPHRSSDALQVRTLDVVDATGNVRLRIGVAQDGAPSVRLYDYAGTRRLELAVRPDGPAVMVFDGRGAERQLLVASPAIEPSPDDELAGP